MVTRRRLLHHGQAMATLGLPLLSSIDAFACTSNTLDHVRDLPSLKDQAAHRGLLFGTAADRDVLAPFPEYSEAVLRECALVTPENSMKWERLRPTPDRYDFEKADWLVDYAEAHALQVHGHTLVWHSQLPTWFDQHINRDNAEREMIDHIETIAGRYAGRLRSWDVVNEAIDPGDDRIDGLRITPWLRFLGPDYIDLAFRVAATTDPTAKLVYNDFGLEISDLDGDVKRRYVLDLLTGLVSRGTPIHALGIQAHLSADMPRNFKILDQFLTEIAALGLEVMITELDVSDQELPANISERDCMVAEVYQAFLNTIVAHDHVASIAVWGLSDPFSWLREFAPRNDGLLPRPLPLDEDMNRKPAWLAISEAFGPSKK